MSSPPKEKAETRAGHPPAVKAGGMRIVQKHPHNSDAKEEKDKDDQDWETSSFYCPADGMEYPFGQLRSAVLAVSPPKILPTHSLLVREESWRGSLDAVEAAQQQGEYWCVISTFPATKAKHSTVRVAMERINHLTQTQHGIIYLLTLTCPWHASLMMREPD
ncbi:hypothetical protein WISP_31576 [Willisornis vidua]|uniref:Death-associated protein 1 n=1 Tax=Willisornis vidua TaxID=1566151 RepID=A0ABQ9DLB0_9PASS|nr:hypothetical protein WISP_31576 [Willisornis vidua]